LQNQQSKNNTLIILAAIGAASVLPFIFIRIVNQDWLIAIVDICISLTLGATGFYIYKTQKTNTASFFMAIVVSLSAFATVYVKGGTQVYWCYPAMIATYYLLTAHGAVALNSFLLLCLVPVVIDEFILIDLNAVFITIFITNLFAYLFARHVEIQHKQLAILVTKDALTGVGNRRALDEKLVNMCEKQKRTPFIASLIMLDLDHFKLINDKYGHAVGDTILQQVTEVIQSRIRATDLLFRYGGEEFVILPLPINQTSAKELAEQLRELIENHSYEQSIHLTASFGVAEYLPEESVENWLNRGDTALYEAKNNGRNQVCHAH
jgi:diguanylate cyclase